MSDEKKLSKADDPNYVFNPQSNRWVKKDGLVGKRMQREMTREETLQHLRHHAVNTTLEHRNLLASNLSNDELLKILRKVIDIRLDDALDIPPKPPKLVRQVGIAKKKKKVKKAKRKKINNIPKSRPRFKLAPAPAMDTATEAETTAYEQTDQYNSDSETSDIISD
jgi:hypothetical protein